MLKLNNMMGFIHNALALRQQIGHKQDPWKQFFVHKEDSVEIKLLTCLTEESTNVKGCPNKYSHILFLLSTMKVLLTTKYLKLWKWRRL